MSSRGAAQIAIAVEAAALIRTVEELIRLSLRPYLVGALIEVLSIGLSLALFFTVRYRWVVGVAASMVVVLIVYKVATLGW